jgi:hypothetical protein
MSYLTKAIYSISPEAEFSYENDDYSTINWIVEPKTIPTQADIDAAIIKVKEDEAKAEATHALKKAELLEKLGISKEELILLLG